MFRKTEIIIERPVLRSKRSHIFQDLMIVTAALLVAALFFGVRDYGQMKLEVADKDRLAKMLAAQQSQLTDQRQTIDKQNGNIQDFAEQVNALKLKLIVLNRFEKEIRLVSNFVNSNGNEPLIGVGGSTAPAFDPGVDLTADHHRLVREIYGQMRQLDGSLADQRKGLETLLGALNKQKDLLNATPSISPTEGRITSAYGKRVCPFTGEDEFHEGLDIASPEGTPILAAAQGKVTFAGWHGTYGKMMIIDHGYGTVTRYAHVSQFLKNPGETVQKGDVVALVGNTGQSTGPHLHYEICLNGKPVNPGKYILRN